MLTVTVNINNLNDVVSMMIETFRMVTIVSQLLIAITLHSVQALTPNGTGRFALLMPHVKPYRVSAID